MLGIIGKQREWEGFMAIREGCWNCTACGKRAIRGSKKFCGGCGHPRGDDVTFYLPEDAQEITDETVLERAKAGPDWVCPYCGGDNPSIDTFCSGCGASQDGAQKRDVREIYDRDKTADAAPPPQQPIAARPRKKFSRAGCVAVIVALISIAALLYFIFKPREVDLKVEGFKWERTIRVEEFKTLTESGWEGEIPSDARVLSRKKEIHHVNKIQVGTRQVTKTVTERKQTGTKKVKVGVKDLGNGYFEDIYENQPVYKDVQRQVVENEPVYRDDPVYATKITYQIDRWVPAAEKTKSGKDRMPKWPQLSAKERAADRKESFHIKFKDPDQKEYIYQAKDEQHWKSFEMGDVYRAKVVALTGTVKSIEGLK
jgi:hypothetical protein